MLGRFTVLVRAQQGRVSKDMKRIRFSTTTNNEAPMQLIANMVISVTDRQPSKILHVYPETSMNSFLSEHAIFEVVGLSELPEGNIVRSKKYEEDHYSSVIFTKEPFNPSLETQLRANSFHVVVCCAPPLPPATVASSSGSGSDLGSATGADAAALPKRFGSALGVWELLRVTASSGHLMLGAPTEEFHRRGYLEELRSISEGMSDIPFRGTLLSVQEVPFGPATAAAAGHKTSTDKAANKQYTIAVFRKR